MTRSRQTSSAPRNPFRIGGVVTGRDFTDRADELRRVVNALGDPQGKLLVLGPRRMGKTSTLSRAVQRLEKKGAVAFLADLSTGSTTADLANRVLGAATAAIGRRWKDVVTQFVTRLSVEVTLKPDPATGVPFPTLSFRYRTATAADQRDALARVLDAIDDLARRNGQTIGVVLDEFQEFARVDDSQAAEWHLRGVMQRHQHLAYVAAGSRESLIARMTGQGRAFYKMFERLRFGSIDPAHMARWIDHRMTTSGAAASGIGALIVRLAGPRTQDVVQLARACFSLAARRGAARPADVEQAFRRIVLEESDTVLVFWERLPPSQQNVLRAVAAGETKLHGRSAGERFGLRSSAEVAQALDRLVDLDLLVKEDQRHDFDSPFVRGWVIMNALQDLGMTRSITDVANRSASRLGS